MTRAERSGSGVPIVEAPSDDTTLEAWIPAHRSSLDDLLRRHGAVVFRDFAVGSVERFERAARAAWGELFSEYGDLPRGRIGANVYESTPYPSSQMILFHNESSHLAAWPTRIGFYCVEPATAGGCTPLLDARRLMHEIDPAVLATFAERGLNYVRNFPEGVSPSWQDFFKTPDRGVVERICRETESSIAWRPDGSPRVTRRAPALTAHADTGEMVFFNQVQLHHIACVDEETRESLLDLFEPDDLPRNVTYGDGTPIPDAVMQHLGEVYERAAVRFTWRRGDMLVLDNMAVAHARDPFEGPRKIVVAMGRMVAARP